LEAYQRYPALQELAGSLKEARTRKRLSQRALSQKVGMPQSHISKIESGKVDIKASSLVEIARALDLEFMLVPLNLVPTIEALSRSTFKETERQANAEPSAPDEASTTIHEAHRALAKIGRDAARLSRVSPVPELNRLAEAARELDRMRIAQDQAEQIRETIKNRFKEMLAAQRSAREMFKMADAARTLREAAQAADVFKNIRNALAHGAVAPPMRAIPAYRLTDGDDDA
jgi:transcriptional regulator with XRE-family HTH domain